MGSPELRAAPRCEIELPATIVVEGREVACTMRNVSVGGAYVAGASVGADTRLTLRFRLPREPQIEVTCQARWSSAGGTGLRFVRLRALDTLALQRFISAERTTTRLPLLDAE